MSNRDPYSDSNSLWILSWVLRIPRHKGAQELI
jgi:hypothetical protein